MSPTVENQNTMTFADLVFVVADRASDAINPVFIALIAEEPLLLRAKYAPDSGETTRRVWPETLRFWGRALLGVGVAVVLAELGKKLQIWPGHGNFPSGHTTFAASAAACLVLQRGAAWLWFTVPLVLLMMASLVYGHWHTVDEVVAAAFLGPSVAVCVWQLTKKRDKPSA